MKSKSWHTIKDELGPYRDIIVFMVALVVSNCIWKLSVRGEEVCILWGLWDITPVFDSMVAHIERAVLALTGTLKGVRIVWSCTPLKQMFIWVCLMASTPWIFSPERSKAREIAARAGWTLLGLVGIYLVNIARISAIVAIIQVHPDWFEILHTYIFKYLFYAVMFLLWIGYVEKVRSRK